MGRTVKYTTLRLKKMADSRANVLTKAINVNGLNFTLRRQIGPETKSKCMVLSRGCLKQKTQGN